MNFSYAFAKSTECLHFLAPGCRLQAWKYAVASGCQYLQTAMYLFICVKFQCCYLWYVDTKTPSHPLVMKSLSGISRKQEVIPTSIKYLVLHLIYVHKSWFLINPKVYGLYGRSGITENDFVILVFILHTRCACGYWKTRVYVGLEHQHHFWKHVIWNLLDRQ